MLNGNNGGGKKKGRLVKVLVGGKGEMPGAMLLIVPVRLVRGGSA